VLSKAGQLAQALARGDRAAVAEALNLVEDRRPEPRAEATALLAALPRERLETQGHLIGITGPPGVGKSSLAGALIRSWRRQSRRVAVLAVDPSSPISGGALLGDRLRMLQHQADQGLFIRSLAGRGELGGLSADAFPMSLVLLAAFDVVLVETIGVGQSEVDIVSHTDTTCFVAQPASGDMVQFLKAGILELPTVVAVNKADLGQVARQAAQELEACLPRRRQGQWQVPVALVSATSGQGLEMLSDSFDDHRHWLMQSSRLVEQRQQQAVAWGVKRLRLEFGSFGVERLGGEAQLRRAWLAGKRSPFEDLQQQRQRCMKLWHDSLSGGSQS